MLSSYDSFNRIFGDPQPHPSMFLYKEVRIFIPEETFRYKMCKRSFRLLDFGTTGLIQVEFSAKCTSLNGHINQIWLQTDFHRSHHKMRMYEMVNHLNKGKWFKNWYISWLTSYFSNIPLCLGTMPATWRKFSSKSDLANCLHKQADRFERH